MDQKKIGKFIADCRKKANLTQMQLAEKLGITDKAISKWERGIAMPDSSIMLELCDILGIGVNELLRGEKINLEEQSRKTEELLLEFTKRDETRRKRLLIRAWLLTIVMVFFFIGSAFLASLAFQDNRLVEGIAIYTAFALYSVGLFFAATMEIDAGHYVCQTCQHEFEPTYTAALFSLQFGTTKNLKIRLRCPKCGKKTWAKRVLPK